MWPSASRSPARRRRIPLWSFQGRRSGHKAYARYCVTPMPPAPTSSLIVYSASSQRSVGTSPIATATKAQRRLPRGRGLHAVLSSANGPFSHTASSRSPEEHCGAEVVCDPARTHGRRDEKAFEDGGRVQSVTLPPVRVRVRRELLRPSPADVTAVAHGLHVQPPRDRVQARGCSDSRGRCARYDPCSPRRRRRSTRRVVPLAVDGAFSLRGRARRRPLGLSRLPPPRSRSLAPRFPSLLSLARVHKAAEGTAPHRIASPRIVSHPCLGATVSAGARRAWTHVRVLVPTAAAGRRESLLLSYTPSRSKHTHCPGRTHISSPSRRWPGRALRCPGRSGLPKEAANPRTRADMREQESRDGLS
ncbi:hypothetical protein C8Q77DRAFT_110494 [Trametes polyzona]|nr:hypothetical protein C8Q77DRAFT_110494 [Trametes polyzona]